MGDGEDRKEEEFGYEQQTQDRKESRNTFPKDKGRIQ